jgi:hypothetical protein
MSHDARVAILQAGRFYWLSPARERPDLRHGCSGPYGHANSAGRPLWDR